MTVQLFLGLLLFVLRYAWVNFMSELGNGFCLISTVEMDQFGTVNHKCLQTFRQRRLPFPWEVSRNMLNCSGMVGYPSYRYTVTPRIRQSFQAFP